MRIRTTAPRTSLSWRISATRPARRIWVEYYWFQVVRGEEDRGLWTEEDPDCEMRVAVDFPLAQLLDEYIEHGAH